MKRNRQFYSVLAVIISFLFVFISSKAAKSPVSEVDQAYALSPENNSLSIHLPDTSDTKIQYEFEDDSDYPVDNVTNPGDGLILSQPDNIKNEVEYDPNSNEYIFRQKIGNLNYRFPSSMTVEEYREFEMQESIRNYWRQKFKAESFSKSTSLIPKLQIGGEAFDKIFGSSTINIRPQGSAELIFGINISNTQNPNLPERLRRTTTFDFQEKIQMNVTGQIGDKMKIQTNYNTESTFDFENKMNLRYEGKEDEIIQVIEAGDVTLPLTGTLITGSQSLFGIKTEMKFGKLRMTTVFSQQRGESSVIEVEGGAQLNDYEIWADEYEENRHFFLSQYFKDRYDASMSTMPVISSGITINKIEVWVTNKSGNYSDSRNIVAFVDIGEGAYNPAGVNGSYGIYHTDNPSVWNSNILNEQMAVHNMQSPEVPDNGWNDLYSKLITDYAAIRDISQVSTVLAPLSSINFISGQDYEKVEKARKLSASEYTMNEKLGYITLSAALNQDEVLAVSYEYTIQGKIYRVGEFTADGPADPNTLICKLIKGTYLSPSLRINNQKVPSPTWELMMKNIYPIGAYQINSQDFVLNVMYQNDLTGTAINYIPEGETQENGGINGEPLLTVLNLDNVNSNLDPYPDGYFDFIQGTTINATNGRIIFPVREPFGSYLRKAIESGNPGNEKLANKYVFEALYDSTKTVAKQQADKNKFFLSGSYMSASSSEISLNALNVPEGSVKVTAGGRELTENTDYQVDYNMGRVKIINQGLLESGTPIQISLESNSTFNIQSKTLIGSNFQYQVNKDFTLGATILNLTERPITTKVNIGDEPISNTIWGVDASYRAEVPFLTKMIDKLPFLETKEKSSIQFYGEFAQLIPGHSSALKGNGTAYIDDFEGSQTSIDLRNYGAWVLASTPQHQPSLFPEADDATSGLNYGKNRALLSWYSIDPLFLRSNNSSTPAHLSNNPDSQSSHFVREVLEKEIFPNKETPGGIPTNISVLNLAFYPSERGPYNFELEPTAYSAGLVNDGTGLLNKPTTRWGGIMRDLTTNDFEEANIEFIEFWMMDPFVEDSTKDGGKLYFNLGNVSEDILRDSRKAFEHGLPGPSDSAYLDTTLWGVVPLIQSLVPAFDADNNNESRPYQDVGFDGLSSALGNEQEFYQDFYTQAEQLFNAGLLSQEAWDKLMKDPASDNFHYPRGSDYDAAETGILDRYKLFNGTEGNSPASEQFTEDYPTSSTTIPDLEDINGDNTLSESESYYQYEIPITFQNLRYDKEFINDEITSFTKLANGEVSSVTWYQFKVPIYEPDKVVGSISDYKSIRFMRMFLREFDKEVVLRFATLDLVRGEWRKYNYSLREAGEWETTPQSERATFDISAVNIEENGNRSPINYVLPPGIDRSINYSDPSLTQLNEQSIVLKVEELEDGDSRAAYKTIGLDMRQYQRMQMEVHAETIDPYVLNDGDLRVFIRIGSDYKQNYYEYEVPLSVTPAGRYDNENSIDREIVWPTENRINILLSVFQSVKQYRNDANRANPSVVSITAPYSMLDPNTTDEDGNYVNKVTVVGNPNLSNIKTVMIGIRNPKRNSAFSDAGDDALPKSGEIWLNELRLTDFDEEGGWAANARMMTKLADFGSVTVAGSTRKPGFGSIDKKINETLKEETYSYDVSSTFELGKFFGAESGVKLPVYIGISENVSNPEYNPLDPDIPLDVALDNASSDAERDSIKYIAQTYSRRKSFNLTNITIQKGNRATPKIYDISNWTASYAYSEIYSRNINTVFNVNKDYRGGLNYNFTNRPENISPFRSSKSKLLRKKAFQLIRDFNFYYLPQQLSFRTDVYRSYQESQLRNISSDHLDNSGIIIPVTFQKNFVWNRNYDVKWDLSKALKLDFSASNIARIDEPDGRVNKDSDPYQYEVWKKQVWTNISDFGRTTNYNHTINLNWNVPINRLPFLDFTSLTARYTTTYDWLASPIVADSIELGNTIKNSTQAQLNGQINLLTLYNKVPYLRKLNQKYAAGGKQQSKSKRTPPKEKEGSKGKEGADGKEGKEGEPDQPVDDGTEVVLFEKTGLSFSKGVAKGINHGLGTEDVEVTAYDSKGKRIFGQQKVVNEDRVSYKLDEDFEGVKVIVKGRRKIKKDIWKEVFERTLVTLMGIKNVSLSYSANGGTLLPGYLPSSSLFGSKTVGGRLAPGVPFVLGWQDRNFGARAAENGWITDDPTVNSPYTMTSSDNYSFRSSVEPLPGMRVDLTANHTLSKNLSEFYLQDDDGIFNANSLTITGNFSMTIITVGTAFEVTGENDYSQTFEDFKNYRLTIAQRLRDNRAEVDPSYSGAEDPETGFPDGFGKTSQSVMIPAFLAAYTSTSPNVVSLASFPGLLTMRPNWRVNWDGLSKIEFIKKYLKTVTVNHTYRSTYNVGSYNTNLTYQEDEDGISQTRDLLENFLPQYDFASVSINEQFSPLLNFDMTWNNSLTTKIELKKTRNLTLSFANQQLTEMKDDEYVLGMGYRFEKVPLLIAG
ncbi:MAG: cell surface protein SprA, partial [Bacteroidales bacterium]|nr:cell surface protein SprA [Bacteroidales bacterium]